MSVNTNYDRELQNFVSAHVYYNVSQLIQHLNRHNTIEYFDDIQSVISREDYQSAAQTEYAVRQNADGEYYWLAKQIDTTSRSNPEAFETEAAAWQDCCETNGIEPYITEALEYYLVSDWLAKRLQAKGKLVALDIYGLAIWGRTCCGQAIYQDAVIQEIYAELSADSMDE
jgi:hypothetical protein